jgi:hypothetical protein
MIKKYLPLFQLLTEISEVQRLSILNTLTDQQVHAILEAIYNVLKGVCPMKYQDKKTLSEYKWIIRRLVSSELSTKQRKRMLKKYQAIIPILLKPVVKALSVV